MNYHIYIYIYKTTVHNKPQFTINTSLWRSFGEAECNNYVSSTISQSSRGLGGQFLKRCIYTKHGISQKTSVPRLWNSLEMRMTCNVM